MRVLASAATLVILGSLALFLSSCGSDATVNVPRYPETFETPMAQATQAGIMPYWFGERFSFDDYDYLWPGIANYGDLGNELPSVGFSYAGTRSLAGDINVRSFPPDETLEYRRQLSLGGLERTREPLDMSGWTGEVLWRFNEQGVLRSLVLLTTQRPGVSVDL